MAWLFYCGKGTTIVFHQLTKGSVVMEPKQLKSRQEVQDVAIKMGIEYENANVATSKERISRHLDTVRNAYKAKNVQN